MRRVTPYWINDLKDNEIFVFGSNEAGIHGAGGAKMALKWGAIFGQGVGLQGQTYAIPTKNKEIRTLPTYKIASYIDKFILFAQDNPHLRFFVTPIGTGLAGKTIEEMGILFKKAIPVPNIFLPIEFWEVLELAKK